MNLQYLQQMIFLLLNLYSVVQIYEFYIILFREVILHGYIKNPHNDQLPVGLDRPVC